MLNTFQTPFPTQTFLCSRLPNATSSYANSAYSAFSALLQTKFFPFYPLYPKVKGTQSLFECLSFDLGLWNFVNPHSVVNNLALVKLKQTLFILINLIKIA
jgi:hypothetical protein